MQSNWDQANRGEKLGLVGRNRKKISQIIKEYLYLPFFILIILWPSLSPASSWDILTLYNPGGFTGPGKKNF